MLGGTSCLGNVRTEQVKRVAKELLSRFPEKFSSDFESNKKLVETLTQGTTRKVRNQIAGYITRTCAGTETVPPEETPEEEKASEAEGG
jgi:small subunit ribosomal protein S17e